MSVNLGGPPQLFDVAGRKTLQALLEIGLHEQSYVLDVGCGALRCGRWLIQYLELGHYCGIEPDISTRQHGYDEILTDSQRAKEPRFDANDTFDMDVFGQSFDFILARSIWTHAAKWQIERMLDGMSGVMLASFRDGPDYMGDEWCGVSHEGGKPEMVCHSYSWISSACRRRGLSVRRLSAFDFGAQEWLVIQ